MTEPEPWAGGRFPLRAALVTAGAGLLGLGFASVADLRAALFALLTSLLFLMSTTIGALFLLMMIHAARSDWPVVLRRLLEHTVAVLPLVPLFFLPVGLFFGHLVTATGHLRAWLGPSFVTGRGLLWIGSWVLLAETLRRWSLTEDKQRDASWSERSHSFSAGGLLATAFTFSFASFDWVMSLQSGWKSTIFAVYVFAGGFVSAFALVVILTWSSLRGGHPEVAASEAHFLSLGKYLFAFTVFWGYTNFAQFFIIWIADLPQEATWWLPRIGGWAYVSLALLFMQFVVPFLVLLSRNFKKKPGPMAMLSLWILGAHYVDSYWLVGPAYSPDSPRWSWIDFSALLLVVGSAIAFGVWRARGLLLIPIGAPRLSASAAYEGS